MSHLATRGVMEILGLDPYQSETQYLEENLRAIGEWRQSGDSLHYGSNQAGMWIQGGDKADTCIHFLNCIVK